MFVLDEMLKQDTIFINSLKLCDLLLMNNRLYPWLILVPRIESVSEIIDLSEDNQDLLYLEIRNIAKILKKIYPSFKLNIANIGNIISQLHIHVIARNQNDDAWPSVVWGRESIKYRLHEEIIIMQNINRFI